MPSTVIAAMYYNEETRILTIVYRGKRGVYRYFDVPPEEYAAFRAAPSRGKYLNEIFKMQEYRYERSGDS
jgi:KTSC domain